MPTIPIDFSGVEAYDNLPLAKYYGSIDKIELRPATDPSKFDQLQVAYLVIDGELTGRKSSEFLSMSPKAAFRLKKWFDKFGLADDLTALDIDDETNLLLDPDLVGVSVIFEVYQDPKLYQGEVQVRTRLLEALDDDAPAAPAPVAPARAAPVRAATARVAPAGALPNQVDDIAVNRNGKVIDTAVEEEEEPEAEEEAPVAVPAPRRFGARAPVQTGRGAPAAATTGPARRTLR